MRVAPFAGNDDPRITPFHLLSSEGAAHDDEDHLWHMALVPRLAASDPALLVATAHRGLISPMRRRSPRRSPGGRC